MRGCNPVAKVARRAVRRRSRPDGRAALALLALAAAAPSPARADEPEAERNRVHFQVESAREVGNDWVRAVVAVTDEDRDPAALADRVNRTMAWALERAKRRSGVTARSGGYRTFPVDRKGEVHHWRSTQELVLEGHDTRAVSELLGELQSRLALHSVVFSVSPELRQRTQDELIAAALKAFEARAELVRRTLRAAGYGLVELSVHTPGDGVVPLRGMAMAAEAGVAPPALEGGSSRVVVRVDGTIQLE